MLTRTWHHGHWQPEKVRTSGDSADSAAALTVNVFCNALIFKNIFLQIFNFYLIFYSCFIIICSLLYQEKEIIDQISNQLRSKKLVPLAMNHGTLRQQTMVNLQFEWLLH